MAGKRKRSIQQSAVVADPGLHSATNGQSPSGQAMPPPAAKRNRKTPTAKDAGKLLTNPDKTTEIMDAPDALRASPDSDVPEDLVPPSRVKTSEGPDSPLSDVPEYEAPTPKKGGGSAKATKAKAQTETATEAKKAPAKKKADADEMNDPEADGEEEADEEEIRDALSRPPPVHSSYLPLPWKGRLGYACLNTYLRYSNPPVFSSRTCRIASILEHRHPLKDPSQPEHATKNRPDRDQPADVSRGMRYVEDICLANVRDIPKMIRWNDRYGIKFLRLSSEMFPFASHEEYGYSLAPFASVALEAAGKVIAQHGHRVTTHPGQFTQLGSPRKSVIDNAIRDLAYHDEMLSLLKLPEQLNKDAVMILHLGGTFGDKAATLDRFRGHYKELPQSFKNRLVLENDDVSWSVHELLPVCEELNIPMVLDFHHHNIIFDAEQLREGTEDITKLFPRIKATWDRKGITQKMHYSEPTPPAITGRQRRKHNPRVMTLPPCADTMDLMIEAKDKEQAVFELMRTFKLPGYDTFNDILPHVRNDDNKLALQDIEKTKKASARKTAKKGKAAAVKDEPNDEDEADEPAPPTLVPDDEVGMGGPEGRVYWPPGMEEWLRPKKREIKKKEPTDTKPLTIVEKKKIKAEAAAIEAARLDAASAAIKNEDGADIKEEAEDSDVNATPATKKAKAALKLKARQARAKAYELAEAKKEVEADKAVAASVVASKKKGAIASTAAAGAAATTPTKVPAAKGRGKAAADPSTAKTPTPKKRSANKAEKVVLTPSTSDDDEEDDDEGEEDDDDEDDDMDDEAAATPIVAKKRMSNGSRKSNRSNRAQVSYEEDGEEDEEME